MNEAQPHDVSRVRGLDFRGRSFSCTVLNEDDEQTKIIFIQEKTEISPKIKVFEGISYLTALGDMASGITHEINNALNVVKANAYFIERSLKKGDFKPADGLTRAAKIQDTVERLTNISKALKDLGRNPSGLTGMMTDFSVVAKTTEDLLNWKIKGTGVEIKYQIEPQLLVYGNEPLLTQLLVTLIYQAVKLFQHPYQRQVLVKAETKDKSLFIAIEQDSQPSPPLEEGAADTETGLATATGPLPPAQQQVGYIRVEEDIRALGGQMNFFEKGSGTRFEVLIPKDPAETDQVA
jgi:signal transduction histidine kinase